MKGNLSRSRSGIKFCVDLGESRGIQSLYINLTLVVRLRGDKLDHLLSQVQGFAQDSTLVYSAAPRCNSWASICTGLEVR